MSGHDLARASEAPTPRYPAASPLHRPVASQSQEELLQPEMPSSHRGYDPPGPNEGDIDMDFLGNLSPEEDDDVSLMLLEQLGVVRPTGRSGRGFAREKLRAFNRLVSEIYSPPRVTAEIKRGGFKHLRAGLAFDLTVLDPDDGQPWDFSRQVKREKARRLMRESQPILLIGSPMCTAFSTWQRLNDARSTDVEATQRAFAEACRHIKFVSSLYQEQLDGGRYFLHEHPQFASSWALPCMKELARQPGVAVIAADQCQFGATVPQGPDRGRPVKKPTGFMSNSLEILRSLGRRCQGKHGECSRSEGGRHAPCSGSTCKAMAIYPRGLCRAMLHGLTAQLRADGRMQPGCYGIQAVEEDCVREIYGPAQGYSGRFKDDLTGQVLKDSLVLAARKKEMEFFHSRGVWEKVPRLRAFQRTGRPPISVRWVDVNKGDEVEANYRSRLVARQLKATDTSGNSYFAPAPPLEALRTVLSLAMTKCGDHQPVWDPLSPHRQQLSFIDVKRAYFNAKVDREAAPCFVELLPEDPDKGKMCGELLRHMYGTRPAADGWQEEYSTALVRMGFVQGIASPNVFWHKARKISCSVHGDDFTSTGPADALDWFETSVGQEYEITLGPRLGPGPDDAKETRALNRVVTWHEDRVEYEADPRQAERLIGECGLTGANPMSTPGVKISYQEHTADVPLETKLFTAFRGSAARANYLSADRIDCQYACKEVCRSMATPTQQSWKALKRIGRYLCGKPRLVYSYRRQELSAIDVYVDTDWAGCARTRKSTSGGAVMLGKHTIKHWSSTQPSVTLSSGEAEFYGVVRGAGQGLGYQALLKDLGLAMPLRVWTDSSAALGICSRQGLGKLRHLDTHTLWVQQAVRSKRLVLKKVLGEENPADLLTKHSLSKERLQKLTALYDCHFSEGRAESAPLTRTGASNKRTIAEADQIIGGVDGRDCNMEIRMPHVGLSDKEVEELYPSLEVAEDLELEDMTRLEDDRLYNVGMQVVQQILYEMAVAGRTRKAGPTPPEEALGQTPAATPADRVDRGMAATPGTTDDAAAAEHPTTIVRPPTTTPPPTTTTTTTESPGLGARTAKHGTRRSRRIQT